MPPPLVLSVLPVVGYKLLNAAKVGETTRNALRFRPPSWPIERIRQRRFSVLQRGASLQLRFWIRILQRLELTVDGEEPEPWQPGAHAIAERLVVRMRAPVAGLRPAVLDHASASRLLELHRLLACLAEAPGDAPLAEQMTRVAALVRRLERAIAAALDGAARNLRDRVDAAGLTERGHDRLDTPERRERREETLAAIATELAKAAPPFPGRMLVFGSLARGDFDVVSDIDLLVVGHHERRHSDALAALAERLARRTDRGFDLVVTPPEGCSQKYREACRQGVPVWSAPA